MKTRSKFDATDRTTLESRLKDRAGKVYGKMRNGMVIRLDPLKPWNNKSQMKRHKRARRILATL
jgi:hypothetical protein